ncbi:thrombospondin type 3 repeat-containing protein [Winogradskyella sp.]|uniref:thrombospondin type 3 repeat-containing protein n=1 Tax=Winogradskyella sp. TaxID=1883156 RepID=UPI00260C6243|nr:thrombospondin type 3 repeat-containing protein [Winogradskyella sp.]
MKKITFFVLLFSFLFGYSQRLELNLVSTELGVDGCVNTVTIGYEVITSGIDYNLTVSYRNPHTSTNTVLTGSQVTTGSHEVTVSIERDAFISICQVNGDCRSDPRGTRNTEVRVDRCETRGYVINDKFATINAHSTNENIYEVFIDIPDPTKEYSIHEEIVDDTCLGRVCYTRRNDIILNVPGITQVDISSSPTRRIIVREDTPNFPHVISQLSSIQVQGPPFQESPSGSLFQPHIWVIPSTKVYDSNGFLTSLDATFTITSVEYAENDTYQAIVKNNTETIVYELEGFTEQLVSLGGYVRLDDIPISEDNTIIELVRRPSSGRIVLSRIRIKNVEDGDDDGVLDIDDNCPNIANADQADDDGDGIGNVCDNCDIPNSNQEDGDNDDVGDVCDNCPDNENPNQGDLDNDGLGDACDLEDNRDSDGDGIENFEDNCPNSPNPNQTDSNNNGIGDACEGEPDLVATPNNVLVISECNECNIVLSNLGSDKHKLTPSTTLEISQALIENNSAVDAGSSKVKYYVEATSPAGIAEYELPYVTNIPAISGNGSYVLTHTIFGYHFPPLEFGSNYKIVVKLDAENEVDESNESNNKISIPLKWECNNCRIAYLDLGNQIIEIPLPGGLVPIGPRISPTYNLKIYNFGVLSTIPVVDQSISVGQTVNISHLPNGFYAAHINDRFTLQFSKMTIRR